MKKLIALLGMFLMLGCNTPQIVKDPHNESIKSGYYNSELIVNDQRTSSIKVLEVDKEDNPSTYNLKVYGPYSGDLYLSSRRCGLMKATTYRQGKYTVFNLGELFDTFKQNCFITITTNPVYPGWDDSEASISGNMGGIYLRIRPDNFVYELQTNFGKFIQLQERADGTVEPPEGPLMVVNSTPGVKFRADNCGDVNPLIIDVPASGEVELDIDTLHKPGKGCLVQLKDKAGGFTPFVINIYKHDFLPLPEPEIYVKKNKLYVKGSRYVTLTDVNGEPFFSHSAKTNYKIGKTYIVRQYTNKGRIVVCEFKDGIKNCLKK